MPTFHILLCAGIVGVRVAVMIPRSWLMRGYDVTTRIILALTVDSVLFDGVPGGRVAVQLLSDEHRG